MKFNQKLNILFDISKAKGKDLAESMYITPPQISKMRKGLRNIPKDNDSAFLIALFFSKRLNTEEKRIELAKILKIDQIINIDDNNELAEIILEWLKDNDESNKRAENFIKRFNSLTDNRSNNFLNSYSQDKSNIVTYYGNEGKRIALLNFLNYLTGCKIPCQISLVSDESIGWISEDPLYRSQLQEAMLNLISKGYTFKRITGQIEDINEAFDSLNRWLPLYITGKATSYYYKRMRDNLNRITIYVAPDLAVVFSFSVGTLRKNDNITFFTTDHKIVSSMYNQFQAYYLMCEPLMITHSYEEDKSKLNQCMIKYEEIPANSIHLNNSLSFITIPLEIISKLSFMKPEIKSDLLLSLSTRLKIFNDNLNLYSFMDIIKLAKYEDIINNSVEIPASRVLGFKEQYYTANEYLMHLNSIIFLLNNYKNYNVFIIHTENIDHTIMYIKEGYKVIFAKDLSKYMLFESSEKYLVSTLTEHLHRIITTQNFEQLKKRTLSEINELATKIEEYLKLKNS